MRAAVGVVIGCVAIGAAVPLVACGPARPAPRTVTTQTIRPRRAVVPASDGTRPTIGGFQLGMGFGTAARICSDARLRFERHPSGTAATCSGTPRPVGYPVESVFLRDCDRVLCQITVRVRVEGEAQLEAALADVTRTWGNRYGVESFHDAHLSTDAARGDRECVGALRTGRFSCLLRGTAMFVRDWIGPGPGGLRDGDRAQLVAQGAAGSQVATIRLTLASGEGIETSEERDL